MSLRLRLVLAVTALVTIGLGVFGVATYSLYSRSQYVRLDEQVRTSVPVVGRQLRQVAGLEPQPHSGPGAPTGDPDNGAGHDRPGPGGGGPGGGGGGDDGGGATPTVVVPPGTYAELRSGGTVLARIQLVTTTEQPALSTGLVADTDDVAGRLFDTVSTNGPGRWRVYVGPGQTVGQTVIVAVPMNEVRAALRRLVTIEGLSAAGLLAILAMGAWLIMRRGLRPLERMAATAHDITAGDLTLRVNPGGPSEVGELGLALNTMLDEIESAFRQREHTERRLRQFLADASHELRTPLTSIQGFAELFRLGAAERDHVNLPIIMRRIEAESARMKTLVEDLLLLARLDQVRPLDRAPVDLAVLAADACSDAVAADAQRRITLDAPEPVVVLGDGDHLRQAIANLVANAVKHTPPETPIEVSAYSRDALAIVTVRDHGSGLTEEALAHAFDRFWRADQARTGAGAGLGLSIVAGIAAEHGGTATVANVAEDGGGAVFTLRLPLTSPPAVAPAN